MLVKCYIFAVDPVTDVLFDVEGQGYNYEFSKERNYKHKLVLKRVREVIVDDEVTYVPLEVLKETDLHKPMDGKIFNLSFGGMGWGYDFSKKEIFMYNKAINI